MSGMENVNLGPENKDTDPSLCPNCNEKLSRQRACVKCLKCGYYSCTIDFKEKLDRPRITPDADPSPCPKCNEELDRQGSHVRCKNCKYYSCDVD